MKEVKGVIEDELESSSELEIKKSELLQLPGQVDQENTLSLSYSSITSPWQDRQRRGEERELSHVVDTPYKGMQDEDFLNDIKTLSSGRVPDKPVRSDSLHANIPNFARKTTSDLPIKDGIGEYKLKSNSSEDDSSDSDSDRYKEEYRAVKFSYRHCQDKIFQGKNYKIFRNNNDDKTKISYLSNASSALNPESSNQESDIIRLKNQSKNRLKKCLEIKQIKKMLMTIKQNLNFTNILLLQLNWVGLEIKVLNIKGI
jgi:hypothetical protein